MESFTGRIAVVTGGGDGMGRALARQLSAEGCHVALCDIDTESLATSRSVCEATAPEGTRVTTHQCDVSDESAMLAFRDAVQREHATDHVHLVFNNAGIGGGGSFVADDRAGWDRTFGVCWGGVYHGTRAFLPLLIAAEEGHLVNTSSVNGFWACLGPDRPHTAYSAAKFAVKGFTEALRVDLRLNAPHVEASVVMPGHIGTNIAANSMRAHGAEITAEMAAMADAFRDNAPIDAEQAATEILDGVRARRWRILVGDDARFLDEAVRAAPEDAYEQAFLPTLG